MNIVRIMPLSAASNHIIVAVDATRIVLVPVLVKVRIVAAIRLVVGAKHRSDGVCVLVEIVLGVFIVKVHVILSIGLDMERL